MCRSVDTGAIADCANRSQVERSVCEFLTAQIAVAQRTTHDVARNALISRFDPGDGGKLHLRGVRKISVAWVIEVRSTAHEVLFHTEQIGAIVQVMLMPTLIFALICARRRLMLLRLRHSLRLLLPVRVMQRQFQGDDSAYRDNDS